MKDTRGVVRPLAPEDVRVDQFVVVLREIEEVLPTWLTSGGDERWSAHEGGAGVVPMRIPMLPVRPRLMQVLDVCLPLVVAMTPRERVRALDLRMVDLGLVPEAFGRAAFTALGPGFGQDGERPRWSEDD